MVLGYVFDKGIPAVASRYGIGAAPAPFEVLRITAAPLPRIGQVKHGVHLPFPEFGQQKIQAIKGFFVVDARCGLQDGFDLRNDTLPAFGTHQDPEVRDARLFHPVEFPAQAFAACLGVLGGQQGAIPEIGSHEIG